MVFLALASLGVGAATATFVSTPPLGLAILAEPIAVRHGAQAHAESVCGTEAAAGVAEQQHVLAVR